MTLLAGCENKITSQNQLWNSFDYPDDQEAEMTVFKFSDQTQFTTAYAEKPKMTRDWLREIPDVEMVFNGAYFHQDFSPSGFVLVNGKRIGERMFDEDKTGLLTIKNGKLKIFDTKEKEIIAPGLTEPKWDFDHAFQSYPFLIKDGLGAVKEDSGLVARRTAIGITTDGTVYLFLVGNQNISLYEFMKLLLKFSADEELSFQYVLNLDGGPSSGVNYYWGEKADQNIEGESSFTSVPHVLGASD